MGLERHESERQIWGGLLLYFYLGTITGILLGFHLVIILTITDDSTKGVSFEVKLDIHVLPL